MLCLVTACYRTTEWGAMGEFRGHATHTSEQEVGTKQTAVFDESGARVTVTQQPQCRPLLIGDHLEEKQEATRQLQGRGWMVVGSLLVGAAGAFAILFAAADANNTDVYGNQLPSRLSSSTRTDLYVIGGIGVAAAIGGMIAVVELPEQKRKSRWVPVEGNAGQVFTSEEPQPCSTPATPVAGAKVHVEAKFDRGSYEWDVETDANGIAVIDLAVAREVAGFCGEGSITATALDQTWKGPLEGSRVPFDQITDANAHALAALCGAK